MRFNKGIHNILVERGIASENTAMLFMCFYGAIRQTNMATDSFNIYLSPVGVKSLNRFVINWQAGAKLIRHAHEYNGFVTLNASTIKNVMTFLKGTRGYITECDLASDQNCRPTGILVLSVHFWDIICSGWIISE